MSWDSWIPEKYHTKSEVCGLEICFSDEGIVYNYAIVKNKGKKLSITDSGKIHSLGELPSSILKKKIPIALVINGKGVIVKKIELNEEDNSDKDALLKTNLPAINPDDFFIQLYRQDNGSGFLAVCRKTQVESLLTELKQKKYEVAEIMIGPPAILGVKPLWNNFQTLFTSTQTVNLLNNCIDSIISATSTEQQQLFGDLNITASKMLPFSASVGYLLNLGFVEECNPELQELRTVHAERNKFRFLLVCIIMIAFALAVTNMVVFTGFYNTNNKLEAELGVYKGKYDQVNKILSDYQSNKNLIENVGILNKNKLSEYADKIAATVPDDVVLSEMYFNPKIEDTDQTSDSLITFAQRVILMKGNCNRSFTINEWINVLKMQEFIQQVTLEKFIYNNDGIIPNYEIKLITR